MRGVLQLLRPRELFRVARECEMLPAIAFLRFSGRDDPSAFLTILPVVAELPSSDSYLLLWSPSHNSYLG